jgi:hypothetical protein
LVPLLPEKSRYQYERAYNISMNLVCMFKLQRLIKKLFVSFVYLPSCFRKAQREKILLFQTFLGSLY